MKKRKRGYHKLRGKAMAKTDHVLIQDLEVGRGLNLKVDLDQAPDIGRGPGVDLAPNHGLDPQVNRHKDRVDRSQDQGRIHQVGGVEPGRSHGQGKFKCVLD